MAFRDMMSNINQGLMNMSPQQRASLLALAGGTSPSPQVGQALYGQSQSIMQALQDEARLKAQAEQTEQDRRMRMSEGEQDRQLRMSELDASLKWKTADAKETRADRKEYDRQRIEQDMLQTGYSKQQAEAAIALRDMQTQEAEMRRTQLQQEMEAIDSIIKAGDKHPLYQEALRRKARIPQARARGFDPTAFGPASAAADPYAAIYSAGMGDGGPPPAAAPVADPVAAPAGIPQAAAPSPGPTPIQYPLPIRGLGALQGPPASLRNYSRWQTGPDTH